jgi:hypothetical protein
MKLLMVCIVAWVLLAGCRENCRDKIVHLYTNGNKTFIQKKAVNDFTLQLSYVPVTLLMREEAAPNGRPVQDTGFYYFKLNVACPVSTAMMASNKTELFYGLDSLFATAGSLPPANPVLVEPVVTGSQRYYEYLLVFAKKDFDKDKHLKVAFFDRLFTNTRLEFVFDRIKIDEIETLQCHAHKA